VGDSSRTHFDAAPLNGSLLDVVMGHNDFSESIVCPATVCPASVSTNDMPENFAVAPIKSRKQPFDDFLDKTVHDRCWAVMKEHADSRDGVLHEMADAINYAAKKLISNTPPAQIYRFRCAKKQGELDGLLHTWSRRFFEEAYDNEMSNPEIPGNDNFRELFLTHGSCFLTMAITHLIFPDSPIYAGVPQLYDIQIAALCRLNPWLEEQQAQRRDQIMQERRTTFASPDHDKEADPNISAPEKVQVLRQSLQARNRIGKIDQSGVLKEMVVEVTQNTPNLAREFFQLNPHYTVQHINQVIDACVNLPCDCADETDPLWHARKGYKISLLLSCFTQVVTQLNMLSRLPAFTPLAVEEER
jgi:hypothetical protein